MIYVGDTRAILRRVTGVDYYCYCVAEDPTRVLTRGPRGFSSDVRSLSNHLNGMRDEGRRDETEPTNTYRSAMATTRLLYQIYTKIDKYKMLESLEIVFLLPSVLLSLQSLLGIDWPAAAVLLVCAAKMRLHLVAYL
jgi:hypothetical protein